MYIGLGSKPLHFKAPHLLSVDLQSQKTNIAPGKRPKKPKGNSSSYPSVFRCELLVSGRVKSTPLYKPPKKYETKKHPPAQTST